MKSQPFFRLIFNIIAVVLVVVLLENKRQSNINFSYKAENEQKAEPPAMSAGVTDFIFFQAINKYLFTSFYK